MATIGLKDQSGEKINLEKTGVKGLQHKYGPTALMLISDICASFCRFCFRRRFVGKDSEKVNELDGAVEYIKKHPEIKNILLSGGDSFMLDNHEIEKILDRLFAIPHINVIRFGSKMPVYLPSRFSDPELMRILKRYNKKGKKIYVVSHIDHPRELDQKSIMAHKKLIKLGISILSQTVFIRGVNDDEEVLINLFEKITEVGIRPYYIFQCRPVKGAMHFYIPISEGYRIIEKAKEKLSGIAKTFRYIMSHVSGKIEIIYVTSDDKKTAVFKYHQSRDPAYLGEIMMIKYNEPVKWLDDIFSQEHEIMYGENIVKYAKEQIEGLENKN
ncbi:MAG: KamA family radical SAM protein [Candidatus ainarchaeum sp.]|nr:KamA family radical SAM protein [Candidatus ainarchaeum sp.]